MTNRWAFSRVILFLIVLPACLPKPLPQKMGDPAIGVKVTWHGQSCFSFVDSIGRTVVIDPFDDTVGYPQIKLRADALLVTHAHFDHDDKKAVKARRRSIDLVESTGTITVASGLKVMGIDSAHDEHQGRQHGLNRIYVFELGGVTIAHLGDIGHKKLNAWQRAHIGHPDLLLIPVGGVTTINAKEAKGLIDKIKPKVVIPMHYGDIRFYKLDSVEKFLALYDANKVDRVSGSSIQLKQHELHSSLEIKVLKPAESNF